MKGKTTTVGSLFLALCLLSALSPVSSSAQEGKTTIDVASIPAEAADARGFVPAGGKLEGKVSGDLNGDSVPDHALKLVEDKPVPEDETAGPVERQRALVIAFGKGDGRLVRAAVAGNLLQCTSCGGAFYGVVEAPADVSIKNGVLIVKQEHGSRTVTQTTFRFRYEPTTGKFALIGHDVINNDRLTGEVVSESTNYLTGVRLTKRIRPRGRTVTSRKRVPREKIYVEQVNHETFGYEND